MQTSHILCPTDFSEPADVALEHAVVGARQSGATLHLLHVVEPSTAAISYAPALSQEMIEVAKGQEERAKRELEERARKVADLGVTVATATRNGKPADSIVHYADSHDVDLIVTATNGVTGWRRWVFGSVAEVVVRKSPCPVLVVPAPGDEAEDDHRS